MTVVASSIFVYVHVDCVCVYAYSCTDPYIYMHKHKTPFLDVPMIYMTYLLNLSQKYESQPDTDIVGMGLKGVSVCLVETNIAEHLMQEHQLSLVDMPHGHES